MGFYSNDALPTWRISTDEAHDSVRGVDASGLWLEGINREFCLPARRDRPKKPRCTYPSERCAVRLVCKREDEAWDRRTASIKMVTMILLDGEPHPARETL
ncbi:hypothetical protein EVAR_60075_1 [Eumeta japonica]|uniref:Uncharacterized protein n=1 Tax=Eumeta variegata TaxID=151549 RepID=A0A4C1YLL2_EUMVA|nr:hypothetical protein EVAR_60075_1 [Eumeta japonica]